MTKPTKSMKWYANNTVIVKDPDGKRTVYPADAVTVTITIAKGHYSNPKSIGKIITKGKRS